MALIDKAALVAEIEKLKDGAHNGVSFNKSRQSMGLKNELSTWEHLENAFATVLKIIDTLEVKEVDIEKKKMEWIEQLCKYFKANYLYVSGHESFISDFRSYAKDLK